jgi:crotonobetainyl-CoA:carnitine CoA-transferase CaiB-like acyl-CoA transferase
MKSVLSDLVVIEIASVLAGPSVGMYFAEKGAKVIKVENKKTGGDVTRSWKLSSESKENIHSAYFAAVNWSKEHLFLDFTDQTDQIHLKELIKTADIILTNFKYGDAVKFQLDFESIKKINNRFILGEISGYGAEDEKVAFDLVLQADTGFMSMNGTPTSGPVKMPVAFIDLFAAHQMKEGILEVMLNQKIDGGSYLVEVSLYDSAIASLANQATNYLIANQIAKPLGSLHPNIAPYGELFNTKDGRLITFAIGSDKQFKSLCDYLKLNLHLSYSSNQDRVANRTVIQESIQSIVSLYDAQRLEEALTRLKVPVAVIKSINEVLDAPRAQQLLLKDDLGKRVKTSIYTIKN